MKLSSRLVQWRPFRRLLKPLSLISWQVSCYHNPLQSVIIAILIYIIVVNMAVIHAKRVTIQKKDMEFIHDIHQMMTGFKFPGEK